MNLMTVVYHDAIAHLEDAVDDGAAECVVAVLEQVLAGEAVVAVAVELVEAAEQHVKVLVAEVLGHLCAYI
jgi:hypothetical protein